VAWERYEIVVIRSTWDYDGHIAAFLSVLADVPRSGARLENELDLVRWNLRKTYLRDLAARGVFTVPTAWRERLRPGDLEPFLEEVGSEEAIIKPVVGANARGAYWLDRRSARARAGEVEAFFADRAVMAQPFARAVIDEGEYSLFYFNGDYSHAVRKIPQAGDFRVQEEHGGVIRAAVPELALRNAGAAALEAVSSVPLYARADFVRANDGDAYWLMELELIEPSLYLRMDAEAAGRFARALHGRMAAEARVMPPP
jgi:glutathione synthase/RimK-type ligase-like ATP-grasp enzyme